MEVILLTELPLTILLGVVFLGDKVSFWQLALMIILFAGVVFNAVDFKKLHKQSSFEKGVFLAVLAAILLSSMNFFTAINAKQISPLLVIWFPWTMSSVFAIAYLYFKKKIIGF